MKFIRKNGRVIPIPDAMDLKREDAHRGKVVKGVALEGVGLGIVGIGAREFGAEVVKAAGKEGRKVALNGGMLRGAKIAGAGYVGTLGAMTYALYHQRQANKIRKQTVGEAFKENVKQLGAMAGGIAASYGPYHLFTNHGLKLKPIVNNAHEAFKSRRAKNVTPAPFALPRTKHG
jgi:hypothetical protein